MSSSSSREDAFHEVLISFFIDFTVASFFPLLCGYCGDDVRCWKPYRLVKSFGIAWMLTVVLDLTKVCLATRPAKRQSDNLDKSAFLPLQYFIAIHSKMHDGELVTFPELADQRAFVLVIVHPCGAVGVPE